MHEKKKTGIIKRNIKQKKISEECFSKSLNIAIVFRSPRNRISLPAKFTLLSAWIFRDSIRTTVRWIAAVGSQYQWMVSQGADVANHHCDNGWPSCRLQRVAEARVPTCTCYLYAVKFISRLSATDHHGFYLQLLYLPVFICT